MIYLKYFKDYLRWKAKITCDMGDCESFKEFTIESSMPNTILAYNNFEKDGWIRNVKIPVNRIKIFSYDLEGRPLEKGIHAGFMEGDVCPKCLKEKENEEGREEGGRSSTV